VSSKTPVLTETKRDALGRIVIDSSRDLPPLLDGLVTILFFWINKRENGFNIEVVSIFDVDTRKVFRCIPGGRIKQHEEEGGKRKRMETELETAIAEMFEEVGVTSTEKLVLWPACRILKKTHDKRDANDRSTGQPGEFYQTVFAICGKPEIGETTDPDAEDPRWENLENVIETARRNGNEVHRLKRKFWRILRQATKDEMHFHKVRDALVEPRDYDSWDYFCELAKETWSPTHMNTLVSTLRVVGEEVERYCTMETAEQDKDDLLFLRVLRNRIRKLTETDGVDLMFEMREFANKLLSLNPIAILAEAMGGREEAAIKLHDNNTPETIGARKYYKKPEST
jgi:8-oxo-dGTP pyrophosphatase MutT (NUDIX family)